MSQVQLMRFERWVTWMLRCTWETYFDAGKFSYMETAIRMGEREREIRRWPLMISYESVNR